MTNCDNCGKELLKEKVYYWQGLSPIYCSVTCAAWGCPNAILYSGSLEFVENKNR